MFRLLIDTGSIATPLDYRFFFPPLLYLSSPRCTPVSISISHSLGRQEKTMETSAAIISLKGHAL